MKQLRIVRKTTIINAISSLFILLFVYTAISKLSNLPKFQGVLRRSPLLENLAPYIAWGIPMLELIIAALLFLPKYKKLGLWASSITMVSFTSYLIYMIYFTPNLPCSCGGVLSQMTWKQHLVFNIGFTILGITAIYLTKLLKNDSFYETNSSALG